MSYILSNIIYMTLSKEKYGFVNILIVLTLIIL